MCLILATLSLLQWSVCFPGASGTNVSVSYNTTSGIEGSHKNSRHKNSLPRKMKRRKNVSLTDRQMLLSLTETFQVTKYLVVKRAEGEFAKVNFFLTAEAITSCASVKE